MPVQLKGVGIEKETVFHHHATCQATPSLGNGPMPVYGNLFESCDLAIRADIRGQFKK
jgi:hypothetical protein